MKAKTLFGFLFALASACSLLGACSLESQAGEESADAASLSFPADYTVGDSLEIPEASFRQKGRAYPALHYLMFPSGHVTSSSFLSLSEVGMYTLSYRGYLDDGALLEKQYRFTAQRKLYSVDGPHSDLIYGNAPYMEKEEEKGLVLSLAPLENFSYNVPIDFSSYNLADTVLSFNVTPSNIGTADARKILVRLTDADDPTNVVSIEIKKCEDNMALWAETNTYVTAYATGQAPTGLETGQSSGPFITYQGVRYKFHKNNIYGARVGYALTGAPFYQSTQEPNYDSEKVRTQRFDLRFDYAAGTIYAGTGSVLVTDLKSALIQEGAPLWTGFRHGKAYLSISAANYNASKENLLIEKLADQRCQTMVQNVYPDHTGPEIKIDYQGFAPETLPIGSVGEAYPLFSATATDYFDKECALETAVYLNRGLSNECRISVKNGSFVPTLAVPHEILYSSQDRCGNLSQQSVWVDIAEKRTPIVVNVATEGSPDPVCGEAVKVRSLSFQGYQGTLGSEASATLHGDSSYSYAIEEGAFTPMHAGTYDVVYRYHDYLSSGTYSYSLEVKSPADPLLKITGALPEYCLVGASYSLPAYQAFDFVDGAPVSLKASVSLLSPEGASSSLDGNAFCLKQKGSFTLRYEVQGAQGKRVIVLPLHAVDVGYGGVLDLGAYWQGEGFSYRKGNSGIHYSCLGNGSSSPLSFVKDVEAFDFSLRFAGDPLQNTFTQLSLTLSDALDSAISVVFSFRVIDESQTSFLINGKAYQSAALPFFDSDHPLHFTYQNASRSSSMDDTSFFAVDSTSSGAPFAGFPSQRVHVKVSLEGMKGAGSFILYGLCGQPFSAVKGDLIKPLLSALAQRGDRRLGTMVDLPAVYAGDVLDPTIVTSMRVKDPEGSVVLAQDGTPLSGSSLGEPHRFLLQKIGTYLVEYEATDTSGNHALYSFGISVVDRSAPRLSLLEHAVKGKLKQAIAIASLRIEDETEQRFEVYVRLTLPDGKSLSLGVYDGDHFTPAHSFIPQQVGVYVVSYFVRDEADNMAFIAYNVEVEA